MTHYQIIGSQFQEEQTKRHPAEGVEHLADPFSMGEKEIALASVKQHPEKLSFYIIYQEVQIWITAGSDHVDGMGQRRQSKAGDQDGSASLAVDRGLSLLPCHLLPIAPFQLLLGEMPQHILAVIRQGSSQ